ncbi:uncharacterized protein N7525_003802 [Penicillium rubens]|uniref:uncharacterized protein n=1 Tax=Penicillium rubens TaxID=1108849 RepID=UPI002A5A4A8B|nr:uncharacterized protein N7525_003802 [Penicillium rubens]KAJ5838614.1 hypothetical protein N7525_003802 [Penicillium rubens]KAJ5866664.1 hypothetical protein N7534_001217 [Penicillium rubens]
MTGHAHREQGNTNAPDRSDGRKVAGSIVDSIYTVSAEVVIVSNANGKRREVALDGGLKGTALPLVGERLEVGGNTDGADDLGSGSVLV